MLVLTTDRAGIEDVVAAAIHEAAGLTDPAGADAAAFERIVVEAVDALAAL